MSKETMIVLTTCGNDDDAGALARTLVDRRLAAVEKTIREQSKYELPELIALPVTAGGADYLTWVGESVAELKD